MKYGVIVFKNTKNIGDDIQSYAAAQLLPQVDYYIDREYLDTFHPDEEEPVSVIMNGWFMYNKLGWPVSPCINPLYLSMHFWENDALDIKDSFLKGLGGQDMREHQPIGCRDLETQRFLQKAGFETWFSACVTLTLEPKFLRDTDHYVCLTDVSPSVVKYVRENYPNLKIQVVSQENDKLIDPTMEWEERFKQVENLLALYQNASAVITTRLHCSLPCLALGTPVLLLNQDEIAEQGRFEGLFSLVNHTTEKEFLEETFAFDLLDPPANSERYKEYSVKIKRKVEEFLWESSSKTNELIKRFQRYDREWAERALWKNERLFDVMDRAILRWQKYHNDIEEVQKGKDWLENQYFGLRDQNSRLVEEKSESMEELHELEKRNDNLEKERRRIEQQFNDVKKDRDDKETENINLKERNVNLYQNVLALEKEKTEHVIQYRKLQEEKACLEEKNEKICAENKNYREEIESLNEQLKGMQKSYSWRIGNIITWGPRKIVDSLKKKE